MKMYKFKAAYERDIDALLKNQLWVSTLENMNDPMDLGFYIKNKKYSTKDILQFQNLLNKSFVIISLTTEFINKRLWNYYTDGMKGFVLAYRNEDLKNALIRAGAADIKFGKISYVDEKLELSDVIETFVSSGSIPTIENSSLLFSKDKSWEAEHEYRIITASSFLPHHGTSDPIGMCIEGVIPYQIGVGYKMEKPTLEKVVEYAEKNGIEVRRYTPDFRSQKNNAFINEIIIEGAKPKVAVKSSIDEDIVGKESNETEYDLTQIDETELLEIVKDDKIENDTVSI